MVFTLLTSSLGWDIGRAITNAVAIAVLGPGVLALMRRANFDAPVVFVEPAVGERHDVPRAG